MSRWRVYKDHEDRWLRWIVIPAHENWWEKPQGVRLPQWDMALRYANRMAQPTTLTVTVNERNHIRLNAGDDTFTLARHEWEPLARFLLAASKSQEEA